uniref:Uncharacterized protein n=1 Tax=Anguilla anguilla TaxID=7936 RepID=A0A0E9V9B5_ANGAN
MGALCCCVHCNHKNEKHLSTYSIAHE